MISSSMLWAPEITCLHNTSFEFNKIGQVMIQQLIFVGCGNNRVMFSPRFTSENCTFIGKNGSGTALELINTTANMFNISFAFNIIGSYRGPVGTVKYQNGTENEFSYVGGAVIANQSNVILADCYFEGNMAQTGGAVYATMCSSISIINCTFVRNFAVLNQCFNFTLAAFGGAIYCENSKYVIILNNVFHNNSASRGGAICVFNDVLLKIRSTNFSGNSASLDGGVLAMYSSTSSIERSLFMYNHARRVEPLHFCGAAYSVLAIATFNITGVFKLGELWLWQAIVQYLFIEIDSLETLLNLVGLLAWWNLTM
jgi:predicted outer membrane repeat protein